MPVHLLKWCVGVDAPAQLEAWQTPRRFDVDGRPQVTSFTRRKPRRAAEVIDGGSLYWIIKGVIQVRQRILDLADAVDDRGEPYCRIHLDPALVPTVALPHRPMQGWRYLEAADAPPDRGAGRGDELPAELVLELRELGLW